MDAFEQRACEQARKYLVEAFKKLDDWQLYQLALAAGIPEERIPEDLKYLIGSMQCCGEVVLEGHHCIVCGSLNWPLPAPKTKKNA